MQSTLCILQHVYVTNQELEIIQQNVDNDSKKLWITLKMQKVMILSHEKEWCAKSNCSMLEIHHFKE